MNNFESFFARVIQNHLNFVDNKKILKEFYGQNSSIKVTDVVVSPTKKLIQVSCKIILKDTINEDVIVSSVAEFFISDILAKLDTEKKYQILVSFDV